MGKIKENIDKLSGTATSSRTAGDAIAKLGEGSVAKEIAVTDKITIGETELDEEKLTALLALLN
jgi:hypothetical protein